MYDNIVILPNSSIVHESIRVINSTIAIAAKIAQQMQIVV